jgi:hypothetical protein
MKKALGLILLTLIITSCGTKPESGKSIDAIIEEGNLDSIKARRALMIEKYDKVSAELTRLDQALEDLDTNKRYPIITSFTVENQLFKHYIEHTKPHN